jgi:hypothetical protein
MLQFSKVKTLKFVAHSKDIWVLLSTPGIQPRMVRFRNSILRVLLKVKIWKYTLPPSLSDNWWNTTYQA